jgi:hypothetical protein
MFPVTWLRKNWGRPIFLLPLDYNMSFFRETCFLLRGFDEHLFLRVKEAAVAKLTDGWSVGGVRSRLYTLRCGGI